MYGLAAKRHVCVAHSMHPLCVRGFQYSGSSSIGDVWSQFHLGNLCHRKYFDWDVAVGDWTLIELSMQTLNLCEDCYLLALSRVFNVKVSQVQVSGHTL